MKIIQIQKINSNCSVEIKKPKLKQKKSAFVKLKKERKNAGKYSLGESMQNDLVTCIYHSTSVSLPVVASW